MQDQNIRIIVAGCRECGGTSATRQADGTVEDDKWRHYYESRGCGISSVDSTFIHQYCSCARHHDHAGPLTVEALDARVRALSVKVAETTTENIRLKSCLKRMNEIWLEENGEKCRLRTIVAEREKMDAAVAAGTQVHEDSVKRDCRPFHYACALFFGWGGEERTIDGLLLHGKPKICVHCSEEITAERPGNAAWCLIGFDALSS